MWGISAPTSPPQVIAGLQEARLLRQPDGLAGPTRTSTPSFRASVEPQKARGCGVQRSRYVPMIRIEQECDAVHREAEQIKHPDDGSFLFGVHVTDTPVVIYARGIHKRGIPVVGVKQESNAVPWEAEHVEHANDGSSRLGVQVRGAPSVVYARGGNHKIGYLRYVAMFSV